MIDFYAPGDGTLRANGRELHIKGANWFGTEGQHAVLYGLEKRSLDDLLAFLAANGFNALRLLFNHEHVDSDPPTPAYDLRGGRNFNPWLNPELLALPRDAAGDRLEGGGARHPRAARVPPDPRVLQRPARREVRPLRVARRLGRPVVRPGVVGGARAQELGEALRRLLRRVERARRRPDERAARRRLGARRRADGLAARRAAPRQRRAAQLPAVADARGGRRLPWRRRRRRRRARGDVPVGRGPGGRAQVPAEDEQPDEGGVLAARLRPGDLREDPRV